MIAVCGECLIDFIPQSSYKPTQRSDHRVVLPGYHACIGGSPLNTAVAIARLNAPVTMISRLSRDAFGAAIEKHLALNRVKTKTLSHGDEPTTIGFVIPKKSEGEDFVFYAQNSSDRLIRVKDLPTPLPDQVCHLHFSSIALQMEPCGRTYEYLMKREYRHRTISLDPNVRPLFIKDREEYRRRIERMAAMVGVFRASDQDLKYLYPKTNFQTIINKTLPLLRSPEIFIITKGCEGADVFYLSPSKQVKRISSLMKKKIKVVDTVGAGDSFTGAFLHVLYSRGLIGSGKKNNPNTDKADKGPIIQDALNFAIQAAAVNCSREGCDPAFKKEVVL